MRPATTGHVQWPGQGNAKERALWTRYRGSTTDIQDYVGSAWVRDGRVMSFLHASVGTGQ